MNIRQYHAEVRRTTNDALDALPHGALGLAGEAGEVADLIKKCVYHDHPLDLDALIKELGDVQWYLVYLCNAIGVTLAEVMDRNAAKLRARYPDGWDTTRSANRNEERE